MRSVLEALFCEDIEFTVPAIAARQVYQGAASVEEGLIAIAELAGLELMDYDTHAMTPVDCGKGVKVTLRSRAWRERIERG